MLEKTHGVLTQDLLRKYESGVVAYDKLLGTRFGRDKAQRVDYGNSRMSHAMVFTGVNLLKGKPTKWKVENSWSLFAGKEYRMTCLVK
jgi:bleomycin hydrolase